MAQEVRIVTWCDNEKKHKGADVPGEPLPPIALGRDKPRDLDLCAECRVDLFEPLRDLLENEGRATDTGRRKQRKRATPPTPASPPIEPPSSTGRPKYEQDAEGNYLCPECGDAKPTPQGIGAHRARAHGYRVGG